MGLMSGIVGGVAGFATGGWAGAAAGFIGGMSAEEAAEAQREGGAMARLETEQAYDAAMDEFNRVQLPSLDELMYTIQPHELDAVLREPTPFDVSDLQRGPSAYEDIAITPEVLAKQQQTLMEMGDVAREGITAQQRADLEGVRAESLQYERGQREAIIQAAQERGISGSGFELASQLASQQAGAGRAAQRGFDVEALAKKQALQALMNTGQLATGMRTQEFAEKGSAAKA